MEESEKEQERLLNQTNQTIAQFVSDTLFRSNSHAFVAFLISFPFAVSSIMAVAAEVDKDNPKVPKVNYKRTIRGALWLMLWDFLFF
jgi:Ni,Fe-hydrogenase III component G